MKKFLVALVAMFCVTAVSAQIDNVGLRFNGGVEVVGQYDLSKANYVEGRLGLGNSISVTGIYTWKIQEFNWTPEYGKWFFDAGVGASATFSNPVWLSVVGSAKLGFKFKTAPVSVICDVCPTFTITPGTSFGFGGGLSVVYHF